MFGPGRFALRQDHNKRVQLMGEGAGRVAKTGGCDWREICRGANSPRPKRMSWACLLARIVKVDIQACSKCDDRMRMLGAVTLPERNRAHPPSPRLLPTRSTVHAKNHPKTTPNRLIPA